jgi:acetyl esterase/lipase
MVREHADEWKVAPSKIGIAGSSAGGHLASTAGTHFRKAAIDNPEQTNLRPDFMVLNYPVISFADSLTHEGSRRNLIGRPTGEGREVDGDKGALVLDKDDIRNYSNELQVGPDTPPAFVTHAVDDQTVKIQNSILFIAALQQNKVPVTSFFYARGGHGYGMDNPTGDTDWMEHCIPWILEITGTK